MIQYQQQDCPVTRLCRAIGSAGQRAVLPLVLVCMQWTWGGREKAVAGQGLWQCLLKMKAHG